MSGREMLYDIQKLRELISNQEDLIQYYETMSHSLGGGGYEEKVQCTRNLDAPFVKWIYKKIDAESDLKKMKKQLNEKVDAAAQIIELLDNGDYKMILTYRYIMNKDWPTIIGLVNLGESTTYRYHKKALNAFDSLKIPL